MPKRSSKRQPRQKDPFQLARSILDAAAPDAELPKEPKKEKNPAAVALGRLGGQKGGKAAAKLTPAKTQGHRQEGGGEALGSRRRGLTSIKPPL
jgi:hypothetical protein